MSKNLQKRVCGAWRADRSSVAQALVLIMTAMVLVSSVAAVNAAPELAERSLLGGSVRMLVPLDFEPMSEPVLALRYPDQRRPTLVLSNAQGTISVAVNHTREALIADDLGEAFAVMDQMFQDAHPSAQWFRSELVSINEHPFFVMDVLTAAVDTNVRRIIAGTSFDGQFLVITFNCTQALEAQWAKVGLQIINSVALGSH